MKTSSSVPPTLRFGVFELDPRAGELRKKGMKIRLQGQPVQILVMLLECPGEVVTREELQKKLWKADTFVDFEQGLNNAMKRLRAALADDAESPHFIETLPRRGYRFIGAVNGEPPQELASDKTILPPFEFADSIAVLPFENSGRDPDMEYLSDGITETLINNLSRLERLRVVPRTTVFRYKGKMSDPARIGRELRARLVLTGHVIQRGKNLIIGAELIETAHESLLWGENYNSRLEDILAVQDKIASEIANRLQLRVSEKDRGRLGRHPTESREAYHLHLKAMYFANKWTPEGLRKGLDYTRLAIDADPIFADAYAGLAYLYTLVGFFGGLPPIEAFPKAKAAALRALEMDHSLPNAHAILAFILLVYDWDSQSAEIEFRRAAELSPNLAGVHYAYSHWFLTKQLYEEAAAKARRALDLDPLSSIFSYHIGVIQFFSRQYDQAIDQLQQASELDPHFAHPHGLLALVYALKGMYPDAMAEAEKGMALSGGDIRGRAPLGLVSALLGKQDEARKVLEGLEQESGPPYFSFAYSCAGIHALLGEEDQGFEWLDKAFKGRTGALVYLRSAPEFDSLHGDPRFGALLRRIGVAA